MLLWLAEGTHGLQRLRRFAPPPPAGKPVRGLALCGAAALLLVAHADGLVAVWPFTGGRGDSERPAIGHPGSHSHVLLRVRTPFPACASKFRTCDRRDSSHCNPNRQPRFE